MISHGKVVRRNFRLRIRRMEAGVLSGKASREQVFGALRGTAELCRGKLHLPQAPVGRDAAEVGGSDAAGFRVRGEGEYADHAYPAAQKRGRSHGAVLPDDRPAAHLT